MATSESVDTKTPWCSQCKGYTEYSAEVSYAGEGSETIIHCKCCNDIMWTVDSCRRFVRVWKFAGLFICGMSCIFSATFALIMGEDPLFTAIMASIPPIVAGSLSLVLYWVGWRRKAKFLKWFDAWVTQQSRDLYSDRK
ncbi:MAG TPA: hypothetical protein DDY45_13450 [Verrucomicrobiales bacterium]|nr:hypothetical protein [Verrucomicrobiales bacterium]